VSDAPVTGMLTVYEDQLRFDRAVDSGQTADIEDVDDSMSRVRLHHHLITNVDISDASPRPQLPAQSVDHCS